MTSSLDEQVMKRAKQVASQSKAVGEQMDRILIQGTWLLNLVITLVNNVDTINIEVDNTIELFSQEL